MRHPADKKVAELRPMLRGGAMVAVCALVVGMLAIVSPSSHQVVRLGPGRNIRLASNNVPNVPYSPGELWGGANPVERCNACDLDQLLAQNKAQSLQPNQMVNPATGDLTVNNTVMSIPANGGFLGLTLNYDAQRADSEVQASSGAGPFGYGWQSNFNTSMSNNSNAMTVTEDNGSQVVYSIDTSGSIKLDGCPNGDYDDTQKYTTPDSSLLFCAPNRVDAQIGDDASSDTYLFAERGGADIQSFNYYGVKINEGNQLNTIMLGWRYDVAPNSWLCPAQSPQSTTISYCDIETTDQNISDSRAVIVEFNSANQAVYAIAPSGAWWLLGYNGTTGQLASVENAETTATQQYGYGTGFPTPYSYDMVDMIDPNNVTTDIQWYSPGGTTVGMVGGIQDPATGQYTEYGYTNIDCVTSPSNCFGLGAGQIATIQYRDGEFDTDSYEDTVLNNDSYGPTANDGTGDVDWLYTYLQLTQDAPIQETISLNNTPVASALTDAVGNVVYYTDPNGNNTYSFYNDSGPNDLDELCWTVQNAPANNGAYDDSTCNSPPASTGTSPVTSYTYDQYGHELSETNPDGNTTRYGYNDATTGFAAGLQCWVAAPLVTGSGSTCSSSSLPAPTGATVDFYDGYGNLGLTETDYSTSTINYTYYDYDIDGQMLYTIPPDGVAQGTFGSNPYETQYVYSSLGRLYQKIVPAYGGGTATTTYTYDEDGNILKTATPANVTSTAYDADDRPCWVMVSTVGSGSLNACGSPPVGSQTKAVTSYLSSGAPAYVPGTDAVLQVTDPNEKATSFAYGDARFPTSVTATTEPTVANNSPTIQHTYNVYDQYGHVCLTGPVSATSCTWVANDSLSTYDLEGQLESATSPKDATDASGVVTAYTYGDSAYPTHPTTVVRGSGTSGAETTNYGYDSAGQQIYSEDNEGSFVSETYDADGRLCWVAPQDVWVAQGACPGVSGTPTGPGVTTYAYDGNSNMVTMVDNNGTSSQATSMSTYDSNSNLLSATDDNGNTVSYQYDDANNETCIAYAVVANSTCNSAPSTTNTVVDRAYDSSGRLTSVTDWLGNTTSFSSYNQLNELGTTSYPSATGESQTLGYDDAGNLTGGAYSGPLTLAGTQTSDSWTPNAEDDVGASSGLDGYASSPDVYNQYNRSSAAVSPTAGGGSSSGPDTYTYAADGEFQKDVGPSSTTSYTYQAGSEELSQTTTGSTTTTFGYTGDGQRQSQQTGSTTPTQYGWNGLGQMCFYAVSTTAGAQCSSPPSGATTYTYNGLGLRMTQTTGSTTQDFTWDTVTGGSTPLDIDSSGKAFIYGPLLFGGTAPVEQINTINDRVTFLASTPQGVQVAFNNTGTGTDHLDEQAAYTPFGTQVIQSGTDVTAFGFQGSYTDTTGLSYLINRYYDPATDQFLSVDPDVGQTGQPYAFTGDDPLNATDPLGLFCLGCQIAAQSAVYETSPPATQAAINATPNGIDGWISNGAPGWQPSVADEGPSISPEQQAHDNQVGHAWTVAGLELAWKAFHPSAGAFGLSGASASAGAYSRYNDDLAQNSSHFSGDATSDLGSSADLAGDLGLGAGLLGFGLQATSDVNSGHGIPYAVGDGGLSWLGAAGGAYTGELVCGGPADPAALFCAAGGAIVGSGAVHWAITQIFG